jgi:hypothetical protein
LTHARDQWLAANERELLPVGYARVVFTLPHIIGGLALQNKRVVYDLLLQNAPRSRAHAEASQRRAGF